MHALYLDIDECANGLDNCSSPNWICKNLMPPDMFMCECYRGFTGGNCKGKKIYIL